MKVSDLAKELGITSKEVVEKANAMGIAVKAAQSNLTDIDATALRNSIQAKNKKDAETKIVKVKSKKSESDVDDKPKVTVKAAKLGDVSDAKVKKTKKQSQTTSAKTETRPTRKAPMGKPVPKAGGKAPIGKPVPKKAAAAKRAEEEEKLAQEQKLKEQQSAEEKQKEEKTEEAVKTPEVKKAAEEIKSQESKEEKPKEEKASKEDMTVSAATDEKDAPKQEEQKKKVVNKNPDRRPVQELKVIKRAEKKPEKTESAEKQPKAAKAGKAEETESKKEAAARLKKKKAEQGAKPAATEKTKKGSAPKKHKEKDKDRSKFDKMDKDNEQKKPPRSLEKKIKKKHIKQKPEPEPEVEEEVLPAGTKVVNVPITIAGFCEQVGVSVSTVIMTLLKMGMVTNQNQNIDDVTVATLADELGIQVVIGSVKEEEVEEGLETFEDRESDLKPRPPIITVMGHVDHGKTSLLDAIRNTDVTAGESGGITQHIGASEVEINGQKIVFLDTPGHEAFTAMRARGADITDIAVLVVAADDSVKPQTVESISHAKAAGVPIIVAINKMDKPGANPDRVKQDLTEHGIVVEEWGGDVISVPVSAKKGDGITNLLEMILLQAEVLELKANPNRLALGTVIEARLDKAKGPVATLLVTNGTLKAGQSIVAGTCSGRIRLMTNYRGETIRKAGPATAVEILGLTDVPSAGDSFNAVADDKKAKEIAENRRLKQREEVMARTSSSTLEELFSQIQQGERKELNLIVKGDVMGSVGAVNSSLEKLSNDEVKVNIIHSGVGAINESDVTLAGTSGSVIIGFNVRPQSTVQSMADRDGVQIRTYNVIYNIIDDVENAMKGMLDPEFKEVVLGECEVRETFKVPNVGTIAGAYVTNGKIVRNSEIRLIRDGIVIHEGKISSLKRFKDDAKEVAQGYECGLGIEDYNDVKIGDFIECFEMKEVERD